MREQQRKEMLELKQTIKDVVKFAMQRQVMDIKDLTDENINKIIKDTLRELKIPTYVLEAKYDSGKSKVIIRLKSKIINKVIVEVKFE